MECDRREHPIPSSRLCRHTHLHSHVHTFVCHLHPRVCTFALSCTHLLVRFHTHTHVHVHLHTCTHTFACVLAHLLMPHVCAHLHAHDTHTHTHPKRNNCKINLKVTRSCYLVSSSSASCIQTGRHEAAPGCGHPGAQPLPRSAC